MSPFLSFLLILIWSATGFGQVDSRVQNLINETPQFSGPNCHNTSLRGLGLMSETRYIHRYEMNHFLNENCMPTEFQAGVLGVIFRKGDPEAYHSFMNLGDQRVLTKDGASKRASNKITSLEQMLKTHTRAIKTLCRVNSYLSCEIEIRYFQCSSRKIKFPSLIEAWQELTEKRGSFFDPWKQEKFLETFTGIAFEEGRACRLKKAVLQSYKLSVQLASQSKIGLREQELAETFLAELEMLYEAVPCELNFSSSLFDR